MIVSDAQQVSAPPPPLPKPARKRSQPSSPTAVILLYLICVFVGAALIAPRFHASAQFLETISYRFSFLADAAFHRYVSRCLILLAILGLPWLFRGLGLNSASVLGLKWSGRHCAEGFHGFTWSIVPVAVLGALLFAFEIRVSDLDGVPGRWTRHLRNATLSAVTVGILEELLFRGALFGSLRQRQSFTRAALCSSSLYALLHFLERPAFSGHVEWNSGFVVLAQMLRGFTHFEVMIPAFLNLMLVGSILALLFERTGSLLYSIGLHAGLVFWMKTLNFMTDPAKKEANSFWGTEKVTDGWVTTIILVATFFLIERTLAKPKPATE